MHVQWPMVHWLQVDIGVGDCEAQGEWHATLGSMPAELLVFYTHQVWQAVLVISPGP